MKSVIALTVGLMAAGAMAAYSDFSLAISTASQSHLFSISEPGPLQMLLVGVGLILFVGFREHQQLIDRKVVDAEESVRTGHFSSHRHPLTETQVAGAVRKLHH